MAKPRSFWAGRAVFTVGLAAWLRSSSQLLPYGFHDLRYLFSLQQGKWTPAELVHPLFVPLLAVFQSALAFLGYSGNLLLPLEYLNIAAAALALTALFRLGEFLGADSVTAAAATLLLASSHGFWEGALRPDPYSLAAAATIAALVLLLGSRPRDERLRYALAGGAAGAAMGLHASALALVPVLACAGWLEAGPVRRRLRLLGFALGAAALALALAYLVFSVHYGIAPGEWPRMNLSSMFAQIEQEPLTSIYTSRDPAKQALDFIHALVQNGGRPLFLLGAAALALSVFLKPRLPRFDAAQARALRLAAASFVFFSLFFLINNSNNGFVYACLLPLPLVLMLLVSGRGFLPPLFATAALAVAVVGAGNPLQFGRGEDALYREAVFLSSTLRPGDMLVVPGSPFPEIFFLRRLDILSLAGSGETGLSSAPEVPPADAPARIRAALRQGRRVYYAPGSLEEPDPSWQIFSDTQKSQQVFLTRDPGSPATIAKAAAARRLLAADFRMDCGIESPQRWRYCRLELRTGRGAPAYAPPPALAAAELDALSGALREGIPDFAARLRVDYLLRWLAETPEDADAQRDLIAVLVSSRDSWFGREKAFHDELEKARKAVSEARGACEDLSRKKEVEARRRWSAARKTCGSCLPAELSSTCDRQPWLAAVLWYPLNEERAESSLEKGLTLARAARPGEAEAAFREALALDGGNSDARMSLGTLLAASGRHQEAVASFDALLARDSAVRDFQADALVARARSLAALGRPREARRDLEEALRRAGPSWRSREDVRAELVRGSVLPKRPDELLPSGARKE